MGGGERKGAGVALICYRDRVPSVGRPFGSLSRCVKSEFCMNKRHGLLAATTGDKEKKKTSKITLSLEKCALSKNARSQKIRWVLFFMPLSNPNSPF